MTAGPGDSLGDTSSVLSCPAWSSSFPSRPPDQGVRIDRDESGWFRTPRIALPRWGSRVRIPSSAPRIPRSRGGTGRPRRARTCDTGRPSRRRARPAPRPRVSGVRFARGNALGQRARGRSLGSRPLGRDALRRVLIHDQADRDAVAFQLLRYRDGHDDDWADIIDMLTMHPETRQGAVLSLP
jgi:hypothetical protein